MTVGAVLLIVAASLSTNIAALDALAPGWKPSVVAADINVVDADYTGRDGKSVPVKTCAAVASTDLSTVSEPEYAGFDRIRAQCAAACAIAAAAPARFTRQRSLVTIVRAIPLQALPKILSKGLTDREAAGLLGSRPLRLATASGRVTARSKTEELTFTPLAYGDFDHDHVADVLLLVDYSLRGGSYTATDLVAVAPGGAHRPTRVAWHWDRAVCGVDGHAAAKSGTA